MSEVTRQVIYLIGFVAILIIRIYFARQVKVKQNKVVDGRVTVLEKVLLFLTVVGMFIVPLVDVFTPWFDFAAYELPHWTGWLGTIVLGLAIALFWRTHTDLGINWSATLEVRENHTLVETGVYQYIRHPMYAAFWLWGIAQVLLLQNWICGVSYVLSFSSMYLVRVPQEEQMMLDTFGERYQQYANRTGRVIPQIFPQQ